MQTRTCTYKGAHAHSQALSRTVGLRMVISNFFLSKDAQKHTKPNIGTRTHTSCMNKQISGRRECITCPTFSNAKILNEKKYREYSGCFYVDIAQRYERTLQITQPSQVRWLVSLLPIAVTIYVTNRNDICKDMTSLHISSPTTFPEDTYTTCIRVGACVSVIV